MRPEHWDMIQRERLDGRWDPPADQHWSDRAFWTVNAGLSPEWCRERIAELANGRETGMALLWHTYAPYVFNRGAPTSRHGRYLAAMQGNLLRDDAGFPIEWPGQPAFALDFLTEPWRAQLAFWSAELSQVPEDLGPWGLFLDVAADLYYGIARQLGWEDPEVYAAQREAFRFGRTSLLSGLRHALGGGTVLVANIGHGDALAPDFLRFTNGLTVEATLTANKIRWLFNQMMECASRRRARYLCSWNQYPHDTWQGAIAMYHGSHWEERVANGTEGP
jgi:hypothetical protein